MGRMTFECRIACREKPSAPYSVAIYGVVIRIPAQIVLMKLLGLSFSIKAHRRGFMEGEFDFRYKGADFLTEYDDYEVLRISTSSKEGFEALKKRFDNDVFLKVDPFRWLENGADVY